MPASSLVAPAVLPAVQPGVDTLASAGHLSVELDVETTRTLLGEVPAAFHAGVHDILLIAFALAVAEFVGTGGAPVGIDVEGHGRQEDLAADIDLSRTVGWFTTKYPVSLNVGGTVGGLSWAQVVAGEAALGAVIKDAKEQLRALPDGVTYGLLRYMNTDVDLAGFDFPIGFNYLGRLGAPAVEISVHLWRICQEGLSFTGAGTALPLPLAHTVDLNAGTVDTDAGRIVDIEAVADVLPWVECPNAVASAGRLRDQPLAGLRPWVRQTFTGTTTCTHLNDTLRTLGDLPRLAATLTGAA